MTDTLSSVSVSGDTKMKPFTTYLPNYEDLRDRFEQWATPFLPGK